MFYDLSKNTNIRERRRALIAPTSLALLLSTFTLSGQEGVSPTYGAYGDARTVDDATSTTGSPILFSSKGFAGCQAGMDLHLAGPSTGPLLTTITACAANTVTVRDAARTTQAGLSATFGHNDTTALQNALNAAAGTTVTLARTSGAYWTGPLRVRSNSRIVLNGIKLRARSGFAEMDSLLSLQDTSNVTILGNTSTFEMPKLEYKSGEHRHCIALRGVNTVTIDGITCTGAGGDGFYIGANNAGVPASNVLIQKCVADDSRRQGLTINSGRNITIQDSVFKRTRGADPESGVDIEPNFVTDVFQGIRLVRVTTNDNVGAGIIVSLFLLNNTSQPVDISITDSQDIGSSVGVAAQCNWTTGLRGVAGSVLLDNYRVQSTKYYGLYFKAYQVTCPRVTVRRSTLTNVFTAASGGQAVAIVRDSGGTEKMGNIEFTDLTVSDSRSQGISDYLLLNDGSKKGFASISVLTPHFSGATKPTDWNAAIAGTAPTAPTAPSTSLPQAPATSSPANGATNVSPTSILSWSASPGATSYTVYGGGTATTLSPVAKIATTSLNVGTLLRNTRYYWLVVATNSAGSTQSAVWTFQTAP